MCNREEYPRPDFVRKDWLSMNGLWDFKYENKKTQIEVPFVCQSKLSGIGEKIQTDQVVYERTFVVPPKWQGKEIKLNFGAVDYRCSVFINDQCVGQHVGGQTPFSFFITRYLNWEEEKIRIEVEDPLKDECIPRGKQFWEEESKFIWYTQSTGIWQSVWIEPIEKTSLESIYFTTDIDEGTVRIDFELAKTALLPCRVHIKICLGETEIFHGNMLCKMFRNSLTIDVFRKKALEGSFHFMGNYWSPENPVLYDVDISVNSENSETVADEVKSYFGMRKIHVENGKMYLNNQPYYHKLVLDQGYWSESLMTAPTDSAFQNDIRKAKQMGFNGCRKHEKVEDPRFLYWADKLGFLVWEGMASFWSYTPKAAEAFMKEWMDVICRDYNHPSIVVWGMLNESWGVPRIYNNKQQQDFSRALYYMAKSMDTTRLVISNDGWEMTQSDICAVHSYKHGAKEDKEQQVMFAEALKKIESIHLVMEKLPFVKGMTYEGQPVVLTECGGIMVKEQENTKNQYKTNSDGNKDSWGYTSTTSDEFLQEYERIVDAIYNADMLCGFCYTQLTDVEQEMNGLLTAAHEYKFEPERIRKINERKM